MLNYPKIKSARPLAGMKLAVTFHNGMSKTYDCEPLTRQPAFERLKNETFFKNVRVDTGGYGVVWDDETDVSESELWLNGKPF